MRVSSGFVMVSVLCLLMGQAVWAATPVVKSPAKPAEDQPATCKQLPSYDTLKSALRAARKEDNGGLNNEMWGAIVDRGGVVCAIAYSGDTVDAQWPGSRVIAVQKAHTANAFSVMGYAMSTANLFTGAQPNGFLYGIENTNPVDTAVAYKGPANHYGRKNDPMVGHVMGGVNVFGGGLALYNDKGKILGALGVSGDTSCADHNIAWRMRNAMRLDFVPNGVSRDKDDQIIYDIHLNNSTSGFGHPTCVAKENDVADKLPKVNRVAEENRKPVTTPPVADQDGAVRPSTRIDDKAPAAPAAEPAPPKPDQPAAPAKPEEPVKPAESPVTPVVEPAKAN